MKHNIVNFLRRAFPFLLSLALWRLAWPIINPAGMLALIPVFFCTFVRSTPWFAPFGLLMCFLIDYKFDAPFVWTALWCLFYALNGFQTIIDLTRMEFRALYAFVVFLAVGVLVLLCTSFGWIALVRAMVAAALTCALYVPVTALIGRVGDD